MPKLCTAEFHLWADPARHEAYYVVGWWSCAEPLQVPYAVLMRCPRGAPGAWTDREEWVLADSPTLRAGHEFRAPDRWSPLPSPEGVESEHQETADAGR